MTSEAYVDNQTLKELILAELSRRPTGTFELACELDADPTDVARALRELQAEDRVIQLPPQPIYSPLE